MFSWSFQKLLLTVIESYYDNNQFIFLQIILTLNDFYVLLFQSEEFKCYWMERWILWIKLWGSFNW